MVKNNDFANSNMATQADSLASQLPIEPQFLDLIFQFGSVTTHLSDGVDEIYRYTSQLVYVFFKVSSIEFGNCA